MADPLLLAAAQAHVAQLHRGTRWDLAGGPGPQTAADWWAVQGELGQRAALAWVEPIVGAVLAAHAAQLADVSDDTRFGLDHHPGIAELRQIAAQPMRLTPKRLLHLALRDTLALLDAETEAHARTGRAMAEWAARAGAAEVHAEAERKRADHAEAALRPGRRC